MTNTRTYTVYCGNYDCPTRSEVQPDGMIGQQFPVTDDDLPDGEVWLCPDCLNLQSSIFNQQAESESTS